MIKIIGAVILMGVTSFVLTELGFRGKKLFIIIGLVLLFSSLAGGIGQILGRITGISDMAGISDTATCAIKVVGIGYLFGIASDLVSELGESALAKGLIVAGKIEVILLVLPCLMEIIELGLGLIK